ncbi:MAG: hypothetical protein L0228_10660 [Planctomycetes bacterium]|nr:hypothetical protein [Planctomycetota bacterium]
MNIFPLPIPDELELQLQALADQKQRPFKDLAIEAIRQYVAIEQLRGIRRRLVPYARAQGFLTDEDVFREIS